MGRPASSTDDTYSATLLRCTRLQAAEGEEVATDCRTRLLHRDAPSARAFLLLHGYTNCPAQWGGVATALFERGHNVLVPRAPGHGRADGSPEELSKVTAEALGEWVTECVGAASGLGGRLTVAGFSFGGVCAAWAGRHLDEADEVLLLAPSYLPYGYPGWLARWAPAVARRMAERYLWWDPILRDRAPGSPYAYRRLSRRGFGSVIELGLDAWHGKPRRSTELSRAALVLNERDLAINAKVAMRAFDEGIVPLARHSETHRFAASLGYPHDLIDPHGANAAEEPAVRERLLELLDVALPEQSNTSPNSM